MDGEGRAPAGDRELYAFFNNDVAPRVPVNAAEFRAMLEGAPLAIGLP